MTFRFAGVHSHGVTFSIFFQSVHEYRSSHLGCSLKNGVLKTFAQEKYLCRSLLLIKLLKRNSNTDFSCEIYAIFKNTYPERTSTNGCFSSCERSDSRLFYQFLFPKIILQLFHYFFYKAVEPNNLFLRWGEATN